MKTKKTVTFKIPPFHCSCCIECQKKHREPSKGNTYPVVREEVAEEVAGKKRVYIQMDCGAITAWSTLYF
jgi:hypothetical protein